MKSLVATLATIWRLAAPYFRSEDRWAGRLSIADFPTPVQGLGRMRLPKRVEHRVPRVRRDLASALRETGILFAALIGVVLLKEKVTLPRAGAAVMIATGAVVLSAGG